MKAVFLLLLVFSVLAHGGDYFAYRPKRLTFELDVPFDLPGAPKLPQATLMITTRKDADGNYPSHIGAVDLAKIEVVLGKNRIEIPSQLLKEFGPLDLNSVDFYWVSGRYFVVLNRKLESKEAKADRIEFVMSESNFVDITINRVSQREKYSKHFPIEKSTPHAPAKSK